MVGSPSLHTYSTRPLGLTRGVPNILRHCAAHMSKCVSRPILSELNFTYSYLGLLVAIILHLGFYIRSPLKVFSSLANICKELCVTSIGPPRFTASRLLSITLTWSTVSRLLTTRFQDLKAMYKDRGGLRWLRLHVTLDHVFLVGYSAFICILTACLGGLKDLPTLRFDYREFYNHHGRTV